MRASAALGKATQGLFALVGTSLAGKIEMKHQVNSSWVSYRNLGSVRVVMSADGMAE